jgi:beta-lactamase class A
MMIISDNTATNMIIDVLGGKDKVNSSFARWQLNATRINNPLPDLPGTNTTSPFDLACLLGKIDAGQLISADSRSWVISTLMRNKIRTLLPMGIPPGTTIADKTGDIASLVGDAGIITTKNGKHYIASVAVERPWNDRRANALIREISKQAYVGITGDADGVKSLNESAPRRSVSHSRGNGHRRHSRRRH